MDKTLRKAFLLGLGVTLLSKDKVEKEMKRLMKTHNITEAEGKRFAKKAMFEAKKHKKKLEKHIVTLENDVLKAKKAAKTAKKTVKKAKRTKRKC
ncbi:MAG: hypothetical protein KKG59_04675 [Nanoarchaeota archaeon]|nr:hypothetical protein [Nanoarchaeota archaeon]